MSPPLFSIIIPTHNRSMLLKRAIESVLGQKIQTWELVIIDDGSTDDTASVVSAFKDYRIRYEFKIHGERSNARNRGINLSKGAYICFMDDDDYILDHHLQLFYNYYKEHNFPKVILRSGFKMFHKGRYIHRTNYQSKIHPNPVHYAAFNMCGVWSLSIPKEFLEKDQFAPSFRHWQDTHLILRLFARHPFHQIDDYSYVYVSHPKMGSSILYGQPDALERIESNVEAIRDVFKKYGNLIRPFLPPGTDSFLYAQKYAQHASNAIIFGKIKMAFHFLKKSLQEDQSLRQWKYYLKFFFFSPVYGLYRWIKLNR